MKKIIVLIVAVCFGLSVFGISPVMLVSKDKTVYTSQGASSILTDNLIMNTSATYAISNGSWLAVNLENAFQDVLFIWNNPTYSWGNDIASSDECDQTLSFPVHYTLEVSSNSTNGSDGTWTVVETVANNTVTARGHVVDMNGASWIRMSVVQGGGSLNEIQVFDLAAGGDDVWFFTGTSISAHTYKGMSPASDYATLVNADFPSFTPAMIRAGIPCINSKDVIDSISTLMYLAEGAKYWAIELGMSDGWDGSNGNVANFAQNLQSIVTFCKNNGIEPVFARPPATNPVVAGWQLHADLLAAIDNIVSVNDLIEGPDLYSYFLSNPQLLDDDGIHPNSDGAAAIQQLWSEKMALLYQQANQLPVVSIQSPLEGAVFEQGSVIAIGASALDEDGTVESIVLYIDGSKVAEFFSSSIEYEWTGAELGSHTIAVSASDNTGAPSSFVSVAIVVQEKVCPQITLAGELSLCKGESIAIDAGVNILDNVDFVWYKNGMAIAGETTAAIEVASEGEYAISATKEDCPVATAEVIVTKGYADVVGDTLCAAGSVTLEVLGENANGYNWYNVATGGTLLDTGKTFVATVEETSTFWVAKNKGKNISYLGLDKPIEGITQWALDAAAIAQSDKKVRLTILQTVTLEAVSLNNPVLNNPLVVRIMDNAENVISEHSFFAAKIGVTRVPIGVELSPGDYIIDAVGTEKMLSFLTAGGEYPYSLPEYVIVNPIFDWIITQKWYGLFYNWEFSVGSDVADDMTCPRTAVSVVVDSENTRCFTDCNGDVGGEAYIDDCGICVGGNTGTIECAEQVILLSKGWNFVSVHVQAPDMSIGTILKANTAVDEIKSIDKFWLAEDPRFNTLQEFEIGKGYYVHATATDQIVVTGVKSDITSISISEGINMIGLPIDLPVAVELHFPANSTQYVKGFDGFWSAEGVPSLEELVPGVGYFIEASSNYTVQFAK